MSILAMLFGISGRYRRMDYWMTAFGLTAVFFAVGAMSESYATQIAAMMHNGGAAPDPKIAQQVWGMLAGLFVVFIVTFWISIASGIKRFHDLGHSGWAMLWFFVPFANIWFAIKLAFFRGTDGDNAYGPSPYRPNVVL